MTPVDNLQATLSLQNEWQVNLIALGLTHSTAELEFRSPGLVVCVSGRLIRISADFQGVAQSLSVTQKGDIAVLRSADGSLDIEFSHLDPPTVLRLHEAGS